MNGKYFTYNGLSSENYHLVIGGLNMDTSIPLNMGRNLLVGTMNRYRNSPNHMGTEYSSVLVFTISMIKDPCMYTDINEAAFTEDEINTIMAWLTSPDYPMLFHMYDYDLDENKNPVYINRKYDYFGLFSNVELQVIDDVVIGLDMTFTTNAPFAWTHELHVLINTTTSLTPGEVTQSFVINTPENYREIYPTIKITGISTNEFDYDPETGTYTGSASSRETITIKNNNDISTSYDYGHLIIQVPREITIKVPHAPIYIDSSKGRIYDIVSTVSGGVNRILSFDDLGLTDVSYIYWPRIFNGANSWTITGNCEVDITYREPRKVGAF